MRFRRPSWRSTAASTTTSSSCCRESGRASCRFPRSVPCRVRSLDGAARVPPGAEPALDMCDRLEPHPLRRLRRQRRPLAGGAEEDKALVLSESRFEILALRIDPELEHAARTMKRAGNTPLARELADIAQVDENDVAASVQCQRRFDRQ